jgi:3-oxoacyl-[acyl-carrier-protein] synthase II
MIWKAASTASPAGYQTQSRMASRTEVVITGVGVVSPIGVGHDAFWSALVAGKSGVTHFSQFDNSTLPVRIAGQVRDFDPKQYVRPRKSLKVMARDTQLGVAAAELAWQHARLEAGKVDPDRVGVVYGADKIATEMEETITCYRSCLVNGRFDFDRWGHEGMESIFPLLFLKILPNMIASHVAIAQDARAHNNTLHEADVSGLLAVTEAARVVERGWADVMIAGGASSRLQPWDWVRSCLMEDLSQRNGDPATVLRPFDAHRTGTVSGEGAAALILESRQHAEQRGAAILARVLGAGSAIEYRNGKPLSGRGVSRAILAALADAGLSPSAVGHVSAHGLSTVAADRLEAAAIREVLKDVPVTAPKSNIGNLGAACGAVEAAAAVLSLSNGLIPHTLNYERPDPACPVNVVRRQPLAIAKPTAMLINHTAAGQAAAVVLAGVS